MNYSIFISMIYKHIIWDWNGTLLDDRDICVKSINKILSKRDLPLISLEKYMSIFTFPVKNFYKRLNIDLKNDSFSNIGEEFIKYYNSNFKFLKLHTDVIDILSKINNFGISQSILSAAMQEMLDKWVNYHNLTKYFVKIKGADNQDAYGKIEIGNKHFVDLNHDKNEILIIGDTVHDYDLAKEIGIDCILIDHGHVSRNRLELTGAKVFSGFKEISKYLILN